VSNHNPNRLYEVEVCGELLSINDLVELTGLSRPTITNYVQQGRILKLLRRPPHGRLCVVCGEVLRHHNKSDRCPKHGHNQTFDRATGQCLVCGEVVQDSRKRGTHAQSHNRVLLTPREVKERANRAAKRLRSVRKQQGLCISCGLHPPGTQVNCSQCLEEQRKRSIAYARRNGRKKRQPPETLTYNGETHTLAEWSEKTGVGFGVIWQRLKKGCTPEQALLVGRVSKTHCKHGHEFTPENTYLFGRGGVHRMCKTCGRENLRARRRAKRAVKSDVP
jgi:hypothetical protein